MMRVFDQVCREASWHRVSAGFAVVVLLSGCGVPKADYDAVTKQAERAERAAEAAERALSELQDEMEALRARADAEKGELEKRLEQTEKEGAGAVEALEALKEEFEAYQKRYRVSLREKAPGMSIEEIKTVTGTVFRDVTVRSVDTERVSIMHENGSASLELVTLEPEFRQMFGFDPRDIPAKTGDGEDEIAVVSEAGDVVRIVDSWDRLVAEEVRERTRDSEAYAKENAKRDAIVRQMKALNQEIVRLDNAIIRGGGNRNGSLGAKKLGLEKRYQALATMLGKLD